MLSRLRHALLTAPIAAAAIAGASLPAMAKPGGGGCAAVNAGGFNISFNVFNASQTLTLTGFAAGDVLSFTVRRTGGPGSDGARYRFLVSGSVTHDTSETHVSLPLETFTYTATGTESSLAEIVTSMGDTITVTATCTPSTKPGGSTEGNNDSNTLRLLQVTGSKIVAQQSGSAISGAVDGAVGDALSGGDGDGSGAPAQPMALGGPVARGLAAPDGLSHTPARATAPSSPWRPWFNVRTSGWDEDAANARLGGHQVNATFGVGYLVARGIVVGVLGGYESFRYEANSLGGRLDGDGWSFGAYAGWRIMPGLRFDAAAVRSGVDYDASATTASGSFHGSRWLVSGGLTGTVPLGGIVLEPSARILALAEHQAAWTDTLGATQDARGFTAARASVGGKLSYPLPLGSGLTLSPYAGLYADWYFSSDSGVPAGLPEFQINDGVSARVTSGLALGHVSGARLGLDGEYGGLGSGGTAIWTIGGRGSLPF